MKYIKAILITCVGILVGYLLGKQLVYMGVVPEYIQSVAICIVAITILTTMSSNITSNISKYLEARRNQSERTNVRYAKRSKRNVWGFY